MNGLAAPAYVFAVPLAAILFDVYCLFELYNAPEVHGLTKPQWAAAICLLTPFGGISFLMLGRAR
jgi:hypothetical protein